MRANKMTDRRALAANQPPKPNKWPRTERRRSRIEEAVDSRQPDLTVVLENVHDPHNASAVMRSCDAVGVLRVALIYTIETPPKELARTTSASAAKWIDVRRYDSVDECYQKLRQEGHLILAAALNESSHDLFEVDLTRPVAIVFGNEMRGLSQEAIAGADATLEIPMVGMVRSLNISVACAITLYEAFRQRRAAGMYDSPGVMGETRDSMIEDWLSR
jgi:tRNA (guanosine-2'-O-)-methyltransferase